MFSNALPFLRMRWRRWRVASHLHRNDALGALHRAWGYVHANLIRGDYYEFGVYRGNSLANAWLSHRYFRQRMNSGTLSYERRGQVCAFLDFQPVFRGFDSFSGMPDNAEGMDTLAPGSFAASEDEARRICAYAGLRAPDLILVRGLFGERGDALGTRPAAIVHLDCDLYASARDALNLVAPLVRQGSVLLCDDHDLFNADDRCGERRALAECARAHGLRFEPWFAYGTASRAYLCHRDDAA